MSQILAKQNSQASTTNLFCEAKKQIAKTPRM
jgi:hypothetical protein